MTIGRDYLLKKPARASAPKLVLDTRIVPFAGNVANTFEVALDRAAERTGIRPSVLLAGGTGLAALAVFGLLRRRGRAGSA